MFAQIASGYITANILIAFAFIIAATSSTVFKGIGRSLSNRAELKFHYSLLSVFMMLMVASPLLPKKEIFEPVAKIWSAQSRATIGRGLSSDTGGVIGLSSAAPQLVHVNAVSIFFEVIVLLTIILGCMKLTFDLRKLIIIRNRAYLMRRIQHVHIYVTDKIRVPFSFWLPGGKNVVIPEALIGTANFKSAVLHELQHHRQNDTKWVYLIWGLRLIFFINPFAHMWSKWISEIQEFACDEALVDQGKVESLAYASCLVQVAQTAFKHECQPVCATGLMFLIDRNILKRRITAMLEQKKSKLGFRAALPILGVATVLLGFTAYASQGFVQDRRITMNQARGMAKSTNEANGFPVVVNDLVLKWLNYYVGTPDGRDKVKQALARMENYRGTIQNKLTEYQMPEEFLALPLLESGYQNLDGRQNKTSGAAGLWQFIESTAQNFGLRVDDQVDERLNVEQETDAAMRYLLANKLRFKDWQLSILSYNAGEKSVQSAILKTGSRDPWVVVRSGFSGPSAEENSNYLPKLMAAILIVRNPSIALQ
jgi:membrane-bound lytic murein transglycosylase D